MNTRTVRNRKKVFKINNQVSVKISIYTPEGRTSLNAIHKAHRETR